MHFCQPPDLKIECVDFDDLHHAGTIVKVDIASYGLALIMVFAGMMKHISSFMLT